MNKLSENTLATFKRVPSTRMYMMRFAVFLPRRYYKIIFGGAASISKVILGCYIANTYDPVWDRVGCARTWSLDILSAYVVSAAGPDMYPGLFNKPPGAVGGRYGSGCFHFSSKFSVSLIRSYLLASA